MSNRPKMRAFVRHRYGGPNVLRPEEVPIPEPKENEVQIQVKATALNSLDWRRLSADPFLVKFSDGLFKPKYKILGADVAGTVTKVGANVVGFEPGDRVFGEASVGGFGEYVCVKREYLVMRPDSVSANDAACLGVAALTALQGVRDHAKVQKNEEVLVNGSSGGVGHFTTQLAKHSGARVTAVCSAGNKELVSGLGADEVIAYDEVDIHQHMGKYDVILDTHGNLKFADYRRMLKPNGRGIMIGFVSMSNLIGVMLRQALSKVSVSNYTAQPKAKDLTLLGELCALGAIKPHIEKIYGWNEIPQAMEHLSKLHVRGKLVVQGVGMPTPQST